jgi:uncharacterized SAM-binding protein YcdF (DUF218 family)
MVLGAFLLVMGFLNAGHFLVAPAQPPAKADLVFALGGDRGGRVDRVLAIYRAGLAPRILLSSEGVHRKGRGAYLTWQAQYLKGEGIPESVLLFDRRSGTSWEEAVNARQVMRDLKLKHVLVVSDPAHMRRLSWIWGKVFAGSGLEFTLVSSEMEEWDTARWWRTSPSAQFVFSEYIKLAYYFFTY